MIKSGIYKISNIVSGQVYVGSAGDMGKRWANHVKELDAGRHHSRKLQASWIKNGPDAFTFTVVQHVADLSALLAHEQYWMARLGAFGLGYNMSPTAGSPRGVKHTAEARARMSVAQTGKQQAPETIAKRMAAMAPFFEAGWSEERREKHRVATTGRTRTGQALLNIQEATRRTHVGRVHSAEEIERRASKLRGRTHSAEARANMAAAQTGRPKSDELKAVISAALKAKGVAPSPESRAKAVAAIRAKWEAIRAERAAAGAPMKPKRAA